MDNEEAWAHTAEEVSEDWAHAAETIAHDALTDATPWGAFFAFLGNCCHDCSVYVCNACESDCVAGCFEFHVKTSETHGDVHEE